MLTTLHLICVESLYRYREQTNEGDGQTTTPSRCICNPPTGGLDTPLQVTSTKRLHGVCPYTVLCLNLQIELQGFLCEKISVSSFLDAIIVRFQQIISLFLGVVVLDAFFDSLSYSFSRVVLTHF
jgi:hypothetical protein